MLTSGRSPSLGPGTRPRVTRRRADPSSGIVLAVNEGSHHVQPLQCSDAFDRRSLGRLRRDGEAGGSRCGLHATVLGVRAGMLLIASCGERPWRSLTDSPSSGARPAAYTSPTTFSEGAGDRDHRAAAGIADEHHVLRRVGRSVPLDRRRRSQAREADLPARSLCTPHPRRASTWSFVQKAALRPVGR